MERPIAPVTDLQRQAALRLASGLTVTRVADELKIDRTTLWRWRREAAFIEALNQARIDAYEAAVDGLRDMASDAAAVLRSVLTSDTAPEAVRVRAAVEVLKLLRVEANHLDRRSAEHIQSDMDLSQSLLEIRL